MTATNGGLTVCELWRYPVKSMVGEQLSAADVDVDGVVGDRAWSLLDLESGTTLTARRRPELLLASARLAGTTVGDGVIITLPDGTETADDDVLSAWLGQPVVLRAADPTTSGTYEIQLGENESGEWFQWEGPTGSFHDSTRAKVSLVSTASLGPWDARRFRANIILDGSGEDDLVGQTVTVGGAALAISKHIDRCVMVTRPQAAHGTQPALDRDLSVLKAINRERRSLLAIGALVAGPGPLAVGDELAAAAA